MAHFQHILWYKPCGLAAIKPHSAELSCYGRDLRNQRDGQQPVQLNCEGTRYKAYTLFNNPAVVAPELQASGAQ